MPENLFAWSAVGVAGLFTIFGLRLLLKNLVRFKAGLPPRLSAQLPLSVVVKGALALTIADIIGMSDSARLRTVIRAFGWLISVLSRHLYTLCILVFSISAGSQKSSSPATTSPSSVREQG